jgi:hypothetical protein
VKAPVDFHGLILPKLSVAETAVVLDSPSPSSKVLLAFAESYHIVSDFLIPSLASGDIAGLSTDFLRS